MKKETFIKGMSILKEAFPNRQINVAVWQGVVWKLNDDAFMTAIFEIVRTLKHPYPDDNLLAIVCDKTNEILKRATESKNKRRLTDERSDPPPPEWNELKSKLGRAAA